MGRTGGVVLACVLMTFGASFLATQALGDEAPNPLGTTVVRLDNGTSVAIWETTTSTDMYVFPVTTLTGPGATIDTIAFEHYTITSDGVSLTIHCYRPSYANGTRTGNNIAGVRLDGVPGYPGGIWASTIISYLVGYGGIESSRFDALGPDLSTFTFMGDQDSELVLGFSVDIPDYAIVIDTVPEGLLVSADGITAAAPYTSWCVAGTTHRIAAPSPQFAGEVRYMFLNWSDGGGQAHDIRCTESTNYTATYFEQFRVTVKTQPVGLRVAVDGIPYEDAYAGWWNASDAHSLDAPSPQPAGPNVRWVWDSWSDGGAPNHFVSVTGPATFVAPFHTEVRVTVMTRPAGLHVLVDGVEQGTPQSYWWMMGSSHNLSAPDLQDHNGTRFRMEAWSDGRGREHTVLVNQPGIYTAEFTEVPPPVSMNYKPFVAAGFSLVLLLVGLIRSRRRPYPFRDPRRGLKTFLALFVPFVAVEAATGVLSLAVGVLAIPPILGLGTVVDVSILAVGLAVGLGVRGPRMRA